MIPAGQLIALQRALFSFILVVIVSSLKDLHAISIQLTSKHLVTFSVTCLARTSFVIPLS